MVFDTKAEKKIDQIVLFSTIVYTVPTTKEEVIKRIVSINESNGLESALNALDNTYKTFKAKAAEIDKLMWLKVKNEIFNKNNSVPCAIRDIKSAIKAGEITITGLPSELWIRERLSL